MGLILNSIQGQSTILYLKKEAVVFYAKEILCNQLYQFNKILPLLINYKEIAGKPFLRFQSY